MTEQQDKDYKLPWPMSSDLFWPCSGFFLIGSLFGICFVLFGA